MPLLKARENLILARAAAKNKNWTEAQAALKSASNALSQYEQSGGTHASDAQSLQQQINSYQQNLTNDHSNATNKIDNWWSTVTDWITPSNNNNSSSNSNS